jgi:hypothetical protein
MRLSQLVVGSFAVFTLALVACSSPTTPEGSLSQNDSKGDDDGPAKDSSSPPSKTASNTASSSGTATKPPAVGTGQCAGKADSKACFSCCEAISDEVKKAVAAETVIDKKYQACECAPTRCGDVCKTDVCAATADPDADPKDAACEACIDSSKTDDCDSQTDADYEKNEATPGYKAYAQCVTDSKCDAGDDDDDDGDDDDDDDDAKTTP